MTTNPSTTPSAHRRVLEGSFSNEVIDAIEGLAEEAAERVFANNTATLRQLTERAEALLRERGTSDPAARQAAATVMAAAEEHNQTDGSSDDDVAADTARTRAAEQAVADAERQEPEEDEGASQAPEPDFDVIEEPDEPAFVGSPTDEDDLAQLITNAEARLNGRIDQVEACARESLSLASTAIAQVRFSSENGRLSRAVTWSLVTFGVVFGLYLLVAWITPLDWYWRDQFAWPFGFSALAFLVGYLTGDDEQQDVRAYASVVLEAAEDRIDARTHAEVDVR